MTRFEVNVCSEVARQAAVILGGNFGFARWLSRVEESNNWVIILKEWDEIGG